MADIEMHQQAAEQHNGQQLTLEVDEADVPSEVYQWVLSWCAMETGHLLNGSREQLTDLVQTNTSSLQEEREQLAEQHENMEGLDDKYKEDVTRVDSLLSDLKSEQALLDDEDTSYQVPE